MFEALRVTTTRCLHLCSCCQTLCSFQGFFCFRGPCVDCLVCVSESTFVVSREQARAREGTALSRAAMGRRGRKDPPSLGQPGEWVKATRVRMEDLPPGEEFQRSLSPSEVWRQTEETAKKELDMNTPESAAEELSIMERCMKVWQLVVQKACTKLQSFEPSDYTMIICGRPVQAVQAVMFIMCCWVSIW